MEGLKGGRRGLRGEERGEGVKRRFQGGGGGVMQIVVAHQNTASVSMLFTITFPITTHMKFGMTLQHVVSTR